MGSADWMPRNLDRRVEIVFPVEDEKIKKELEHVLDLEFRDNVKAHLLQPDGTYEKQDKRGKTLINSQMEFCAEDTRKKTKKQKKDREKPFQSVHPGRTGQRSGRIKKFWITNKLYEGKEIMSNEKQSFLKRKNVIISFKRYGIDAMGSMALGLFASLLIGTIINTIGQNVCPGSFVSEKLLEIGGYATSVTGAAMALAIGHALQAPPLVMYSLCAVGAACNAIGGSGGPLAVFFCGSPHL